MSITNAASGSVDLKSSQMSQHQHQQQHQQHQPTQHSNEQQMQSEINKMNRKLEKRTQELQQLLSESIENASLLKLPQSRAKYEAVRQFLQKTKNIKEKKTTAARTTTEVRNGSKPAEK